MRITAAVLYDVNKPYSIEPVELDPPKRGEVLVKVGAAGICRSDLHFQKGEASIALPAVLVVFQLDPTWVPAAFAAVAGGHLLPYAWVHRTSLYLALGIVVALVPVGIRLLGGPTAAPYCLLAWSSLYLLGAILVRWQVAAREALPLGAREVE